MSVHIADQRQAHMAQAMAADKYMGMVREALTYSIPKGYKPWKEIIYEIGNALGALLVPLRGQTRGFEHYALMLGLWLSNRSPMYTIKRDLLQAFELSEIVSDKGLLVDIKPPLPTLMVLFPSKSVLTPDGEYLENLTLHFTDTAHPENSCGVFRKHSYEIRLDTTDYQYGIMWAAGSPSGIIWHSNSFVTEDGNLKICLVPGSGSVDLTQADSAFLHKINSIAVQILLSLTYRPDLLGEEALGTLDKPKGFGAAAPGRSPILRPRWLGEGFKLPARSPAGDKTHSSPTAHWRRGHWKRVPVGPRDQGGRKWTFIQPTFVNG